MAEMMALKDPKDQLRFIIKRAFDEIRNNSEHNKLLMMLSLHLDEFPIIKEVIAGKYHGSMPLFTELLKGAGIPDHEAETRFLAAFFDGVALQYHVLGYILPLEQMEQDLLTRYNVI